MKFNKTEESVYTLLSLCTLSLQAFDSLYGEEDIWDADFNSTNPKFQHLVNDTIHEALVYQILLKACSYLEEWDKVFGVRTDPKDEQQILKIKKIVKPAYKCIVSWTQLRDFRNQAVAHNHRDKNGKNIYLNNSNWHSPQSNGEIYLLVFCIKTMTDIMVYYYFSTVEKFKQRGIINHQDHPKGRMSDQEILIKSREIHRQVSESFTAARLKDQK